MSEAKPVPYQRTPYLVVYREAVRSDRKDVYGAVGDHIAVQSLLLRGDSNGERGFVVHGTMADPRWVDVTIDPNERAPGSYIGDPKLANNGLAALARFTSLRSWLSQWSLETAQVDAVDAASRISKPMLVIVNGADDACPTTHPEAIYEAIAHARKQKHYVPGANHYYAGQKQKPQLRQALDLVSTWIGNVL